MAPLSNSISRHSADKLFSAVQVNPLKSHPQFLNQHFVPNKVLPEDFDARGAGIYMISYKKQIIYVGKFRGSTHSLKAGNILKSRWDKHLGTLTLRGQRTTLKPATIAKLAISAPKHKVTAALIASSAFDTITRDRGCVTSPNRIAFALENWNSLSQSPESFLRDFEFTYLRFESLSESRREVARSLIGRIEKAAIVKIKPRCNYEIQAGTSLNLTPEDAIKILKKIAKSELA